MVEKARLTGWTNQAEQHYENSIFVGGEVGSSLDFGGNCARMPGQQRTTGGPKRSKNGCQTGRQERGQRFPTDRDGLDTDTREHAQLRGRAWC